MRRILTICAVIAALCLLLALPACAAGATENAAQPNYLLWAALSLAGGAVLSFLAPMSYLKGQLKSVRRQPDAEQYLRPGSFHLTHSADRFLYRNTTRVEKPKEPRKRR